MTYRGLLTAEEARKCVEAGYEGDWLEYRPGSIDTVGPIEPFGNCGPVDGYAPPPGHFLPMATVPRDGRWMYADLGSGDPCVTLVMCTVEDGTSYWFEAGRSWETFGEHRLNGWSPIITAE